MCVCTRLMSTMGISSGAGLEWFVCVCVCVCLCVCVCVCVCERERQRETHVHHGDLLWCWAGVVGAVGQHAVGLRTHVLVHVLLHLLTLLPGDQHHGNSIRDVTSKHLNGHLHEMVGPTGFKF